MYINFDLLVLLAVLSDSCFSIAYPNTILEKPVVKCEPGRILIEIQTNKSNPSHIYAEDYFGDPDCASKNVNWLNLSLGNCGMTAKKTRIPASIIYRICITVQLHPFFITNSDRSYCAQCVYMDRNVVENLQQSFSVSNSAPFNLEPQFDMATPRCSYEIRRSSVNGPLVRYALLGETVYHVWKCFGENFQMLVQNCYVEDGEGNHILIINNEGCGVDRYILKTPVYSTDRKTASQAMHVFKFAKKAITRFTCQIRICKQSDEVCYSSESSGQCEAIGEVELEAMERNKPEDGLERNKTEDGHSKVSWTGRPSTIHIVPAAATIKRFKNITTRRPDLTIPKNTMTTEATATETDEPFSTGISDDYGLYSNISPPSIKPAEEMIEVDPSTYQKRAKRKSFPNELAEREITLKSNEDYPAYDVSGVLTVLESPNDVVYFENKYLLAGDHHGTIDAISHPLARRMPQAIFSALLATIALSVLMMYILVRCITESRTRPTTWHEMAGHDSH